MMKRDARLQPATPEQVSRFSVARSVPFETAEAELERLRVRQIEAQTEDPFLRGYEPPIWYVVKALVRGLQPSDGEIAHVRRRLGLDWDAFAERMRTRLGFAHPVSEILIMGANRAGKTDFAAKTIMQTCYLGAKEINVGFQSLPTGKQVQMPRIWNYMPNDCKARNIAGKKATDVNEHISYTRQNGFSGSKITFGNGSSVRFVSYEADVSHNMEGSALDMCWLDEEFMKTFLDAARFRLASKRGTLICTFTPVHGYTPVVADFLADMRVTRWHTTWMLPRDGGAPMPWNELGLTKDEYERLVAWRNENSVGDPGVPESRPEDCFEWLFDEGSCDGLADVPPGRAFGRTPRIGVCRGGEAAAVWFYGRDNPYGMPGEVIVRAAANKSALKEIKCRVYGIAEQIKGRMFPEFKRERNVISASELPARLVRFMVVDPAPERNWSAGWYGYEPVTDVLYKYRDWPGDYDIPGVGHPGPWAIPSDRRIGVNDGDRGPAQDPFGFGFLAYKFEWARLERWKNYADWLRDGHRADERYEDWDLIEQWSEIDGVAERMAYRVIDARAGSQSKIHSTESVSLFEDVSRLAEGFQPASGQKIDVGVNVLRDRISSGRYKIVDSCTNTIFAYETYCGADGQKGACKDFADLDRYAVLSGFEDYRAEDATEIAASPTSSDSVRNTAERRLPAARGPRKSRIWWS